jgi:lipoprotein-releasing system permease protein
VYFIVLTLIVLVAAFNIVATLIMVVMEKRKDIAILKSMGATDGSIARIFVFKGLVIGLVGAVLGNAGGLGISWLISQYKLPLPHGVFFTETVPVDIVPGYFVAVTIAAFFVCLCVTLYPASRAARVAPPISLTGATSSTPYSATASWKRTATAIWTAWPSTSSRSSSSGRRRTSGRCRCS